MRINGFWSQGFESRTLELHGKPGRYFIIAVIVGLLCVGTLVKMISDGLYMDILAVKLLRYNRLIIRNRLLDNHYATPYPVIAVDGPSGSGKGTVCVQLAQQLGFKLLDSGALYRLVALAVDRSAADNARQTAIASTANEADITHDVVHEAAIADIALNLDTSFETDGAIVRVFLNKIDVTDAIRTETCGNQASKVAALPMVRQALLERQRAFAEKPGLIADGRDMGTVVFPMAVAKIFLTASAEERAERRYKQLKQKGLNVNLAHLSREIQERDERDASRAISPLIPAEDAIILDTSGMSIDEVVTEAITIGKSRLNSPI